MKKQAILSVSDKNGIVEFAAGLADLGYEILATGNTAKKLRASDVACTEISDLTGFPEIFDGRVKTLHPKIFGGILMRRDREDDLADAEKNGINPIDVVCVNLYPFPEVVKRKDLDLQTKLENIDIGGPSLIRAAAKNFKDVLVVTNPDQYTSVLDGLKTGEVTVSERKALAGQAFAHTSFYDTLIADFFETQFNIVPEFFRSNAKVVQGLRYGENPHQQAAVFGDFFEYFEVLHGKELSYNNIIDLVGAVELSLELGNNSCTIVKHTNPCGAALGATVLDAYQKALSCDPVSAFGGIVAFQDELDAETAAKLNEIFLEIICAPSFSDDALELLRKKKNRRLVKLLKSFPEEFKTFKNIPGGVIVQTNDNSKFENLELKTATTRECSAEELDELRFAWKVCKHTKSNAIIFAKNKKSSGVGAGQMSRVDSTKIAASKAEQFGHELKGAVAASDAFFPFADGIEEMAKHGITAVIQPGGSVRDAEVIEAADKNNIAMVFTGIRNFKH